MAVNIMLETQYQQLLLTPAGFKIQGIKALIVDQFTLEYLTMTQTKERLARDELTTTISVDKIDDFAFMPNVTGIAFMKPTDENIAHLQLWEVELLFLVYYVSNYILKYFATSNADDKFQQIISSWRLFMNYSLTQEGQKYDFDRIRPQSTIQSRYLIFQKGKIEITTCNKRTAMTKINAVEMFREGQLIHLTNLGSSEAFVFSSFLGPTKNSQNIVPI
ncbi:Conserved_hypothetical protein [Hexamita inflata]|uniref:Uncharacterized protein n=1 Tax=Hexamita inflata TaxID=28002 RepID=A0AA86PL60_9EUKA|nr:Conserved hypothetical protein [Hexamita inflata]